MASKAIRTSPLWTCVHFAVILACAFQLLYPPVQHYRLFEHIFSLVLMPAYFYLLIRSIKEDRTANLAIGEIHAQVKSGRRLPMDKLALATTAALLLTSIYSSLNPG